MLSDRLQELKARLPIEVNLLAVSKGQAATSIRILAELGQVDFGESRFQEAFAKIEALKDFDSIRWHFIGRLQSNKVRRVVKYFDVIHSVDSFELAKRVSRIAGEENRNIHLMLQVKFRDDPSKGGFEPKALLGFWENLLELPNIKVDGLMTMAPIQLDLIERKELFKDCRILANTLDLKDCSMGMSQDWEIAVDEGATWIRLGSTLFNV